MNQSKSKVEEYLDTFSNKVSKRKEILPFVILVPTLIGGGWQALELMSIDPAFIRFFSVSQLIPDGILVLSIIVFFIISIILSNIGFKFKDIFYSETFSEYSTFHLIRGIILMISSTVMFGVFLYFFDVQNHGTSRLRILEVLFLIFLIIFLSKYFLRGLFLVFFECFLLYCRINKDRARVELNNFLEKKGKLYSLFFTSIQLTSLIVLPIIAGGMILTIISLRNKIIFPERVENINYIFREVKNQYGSKQQSKILYLNDKYIFVELVENNQDVRDGKIPTKIIIYKNENILFND